MNIANEEILDSDTSQKMIKEFNCFKEEEKYQNGIVWIEEKKKEHNDRMKGLEEQKREKINKIMKLFSSLLLYNIKKNYEWL